ncbi:MAG TPA: NUDIX hydrolase [Paenisporosarcina sp.]|nr:NUDIX hydrolase [Paenisporosarcina sp.]
MRTKLIIVDSNDNIIDHRFYDDVDDFKNAIYRVSRLWLEDKEGNILLSKRSANITNPNLWSFAAAGMNDEGETYESSIIREAQEELGLKIDSPKLIGKLFLKYPNRQIFSANFRTVLDEVKPSFKYNKEEVGDVRWFTRKELANFLEDNESECVPLLKEIITKLKLI